MLDDWVEQTAKLFPALVSRGFDEPWALTRSVSPRQDPFRIYIDGFVMLPSSTEARQAAHFWRIC